MTEHWCDCCCTYIQPGEEYEGRVELVRMNGKKKLIVWKEHCNPCCEPPEDPDKDERRKQTPYRELPKAA